MSIQVEIDGTKHNFTAFANRFYEEGGKKPKFNIKPPRIPSQPSQVVDKYQVQLDTIMAQKTAIAQKKEQFKAVSIAVEEQANMTENDVPF